MCLSAPTTIYLIRHGQTEWNVEQRLQGHQDSPLTEMGMKQAEWLGESLADEHIDIMYASPSLRAYRTAETIRGQREIAIRKSDALREINMGVWEGQTQSEVKGSYPEQFDYFWHDPAKFCVLGSESFGEVSARAIRMIHQILDEHQGQTIAIVTHTVVVKLVMAFFEKRPMALI